MKTTPSLRVASLVFGVAGVLSAASAADDDGSVREARIDGNGPGWHALGENDFANVNCDADTWTWKKGLAHCTGKPVGVIRSQKPYTNFELVAWASGTTTTFAASTAKCGSG